jgi:hypothetical protein
MALKQVSSTKPRSGRGVKVAQPVSVVPSDPSLCASGVAVIETEARALASLTQDFRDPRERRHPVLFHASR